MMICVHPSTTILDTPPWKRLRFSSDLRPAVFFFGNLVTCECGGRKVMSGVGGGHHIFPEQYCVRVCFSSSTGGESPRNARKSPRPQQQPAKLQELRDQLLKQRQEARREKMEAGVSEGAAGQGAPPMLSSQKSALKIGEFALGTCW